ncbi:abl interactor 1-like [Sycon ciliatum]|uniref:abl interactor 1-like n=1 Tax=Sycon ciliatum TaxID=27933 RepID=UPI0031F6CD55
MVLQVLSETTAVVGKCIPEGPCTAGIHECENTITVNDSKCDNGLNESTSSVLGVLNVVDDTCQSILSDASQIILNVEVHREKVAKREANGVCKPKLAKKRQQKIIPPKHIEVAVYTGHKTLNMNLLDKIGCGPMDCSVGQTEYGLTPNDLLLGGDVLANVPGNSPIRSASGPSPWAMGSSSATRTRWGAPVDTVGFFEISTPRPPTASESKEDAGSRPGSGRRETLPTCLSPSLTTTTTTQHTNRPRSSSLNGIHAFALSNQENICADQAQSAQCFTFDESLTTAGSRRATLSATAASRKLSKSENDIYSNWPQVRKESLQRMEIGPTPPPPMNPPPNDSYMNVQRRSTLTEEHCPLPRLPPAPLSNTADSTDDAIQYETVMCDTVKPLADDMSLSPSPAPTPEVAKITETAKHPTTAWPTQEPIEYDAPIADVMDNNMLLPPSVKTE